MNPPYPSNSPSPGGAGVNAMTSNSAVERVASAAAPPMPAVDLVSRGSGVRARAEAAAKRTIDFTVSAALLLFLLPLITIVAALIKLDSPGPIFYRARRVGHRGGQLAMLKFRKMRDDAAGMALTLADDDRFTRVGLWLAKLKIDEIPQLWHVLRGEMSLVGPRPESAPFVSRFADEYDAILTAKPGIIGLSQIAFAEEGRILDDDDPVGHYLERIMPQKIAMDLMYVENRSLAIDLRVLTWSLVAVLLRRQVAVRRADGRMNLRKR